MNAHDQDDFLQTLGHLFDGTASEFDREQFAQQLAGNVEAQAVFMKFVVFDLDLEWLSGRRAKQDFFAAASETTSALADVSSSNQLRKSAISSLPAEVVQKRRFFSQSVLQYAALVALCFYGSFVLIAWNLRPDKLPSFAAGSLDAVAVVRGTTEVQWSKNVLSKSAESPVLSGERLKIESGTIELELNAGTKLVVEGPAEWSIDDENAMTLNRGRLVARVPDKAIGFTVKTATATVVDLGTEFAVEADERGATEVQVLKGKVELRTGANRRDDASITETLAAGTARRIEQDGSDGSVIVRKVAPTPDRFTQRSPSGSSSEVRQIRVEGAYASSTHPDPVVDVRHLIDGSGLKGDLYSSVISQHNMWHSDLGSVKNVFVSFDLARPFRLQSMKVWNFNGFNGACLRMGVKQADIYVSISGKGDPLSQPAEWKSVVVDQQFAPATGTPDYATPTVVLLADVEARFVAIVIDEALGHDPQEASQHDMVGLSEVQFFGSRLEPSRREGIQHKNR